VNEACTIVLGAVYTPLFKGAISSLKRSAVNRLPIGFCVDWLLGSKYAHRALINAELEPYLGFLHSTQFGKPSLVCDFQELYRYLIDDYLIERCQKLHKNDFVLITDFMMRLKMGKRIHLCEYEADGLADGLNSLFDTEVNVPRIRYGNKQTLDTLISEETSLLAKFLRNERNEWKPRIPNI
jgi:CRISPR/Cas system-associated endonuclease Cas1